MMWTPNGNQSRAEPPSAVGRHPQHATRIDAARPSPGSRPVSSTPGSRRPRLPGRLHHRDHRLLRARPGARARRRPSSSTHQKSAGVALAEQHVAGLERHDLVAGGVELRAAARRSTRRRGRASAARRPRSPSIRSSPGSGARGRPTSRPHRPPTRPASSSRAGRRRRRTRRARWSRARTATRPAASAACSVAGQQVLPGDRRSPCSSRATSSPSQSVRGDAPMKTNSQLVAHVAPRCRCARSASVIDSRWPSPRPATTSVCSADLDVRSRLGSARRGIATSTSRATSPRTSSTTRSA